MLSEIDRSVVLLNNLKTRLVYLADKGPVSRFNMERVIAQLLKPFKCKEKPSSSQIA